MHEIHIQNLLVRPVIGVYDFERLAPRDIYLDVRLTIARGASDDAIRTTLDYDEVVEKIEAVGTTLAPQLLETLADALVDACLQFPAVTKVELTLRKPGALKNGDVSLVTTKENTVL